MSDPRGAKDSGKKLQSILNSANKLFAERGFRKVSIEEICAAAHVSKMTFYKYFKDKDELLTKIFSDGIEKNIARFLEIVDSPVSFREKIEALIEYKLGQASRYSKALLEDIFHGNQQLQKLIAENQEESRRLFRKFYAMGVKEGAASPEIDPDFFIAASEFIVQMGNTPALIRLYPDPHDRTRHLTTFFFYGIMGNGTPGKKTGEKELPPKKKREK